MDSPSTISSDLQGKTAGLGLPARIAAPAATVRANEAGTVALESAEAVEDGSSPRLVTRGESLCPPHPIQSGESCRLVSCGNHARIEIIPLPKEGVLPFAALTDWLSVTFPFEGTPAAIGNLVRQVEACLSPKFGGLTDRNCGMHGYKHSLDFDGGGARFAYGGQRGTGLLSFPGTACALISDWDSAYRFLRDVLHARISRWDGAVDDFEGTHSVDLALAWYLDGRFGTGGNRPSMKQAGNWAEPDGSGRTLYVGKGKNGKMLRAYEKGKQLGDKTSPWVRWEVQFGNRDRHIPLEVLINPGPYIAASYDCMHWVSEEASRIRTIARTGQISYEALKHHASVAYGPLINVMMDIEGSAERVVETLRREGIPRRLQLPDIDVPLKRLISNTAEGPAAP